MKIIYFFLFNLFIPILVTAQESYIKNSVPDPIHFSWQENISYSESFLFKPFFFYEENISMQPKKTAPELATMKFDLTGKEINTTSQFNHFSVIKDLQEIKAWQSLNPNDNYPFSTDYRKSLICNPYPLFEVKIFKGFGIGI